MIETRIKNLREDNDKTQKQISEYLKCDRSDYAKMEKGKRAVPLWIADKLADYYGTSIDYLVGKTDAKEPYARKS